MSEKKIPHSVMLVFVPIVIFFLLFFAVPSVSESFFGVSIKNTGYTRHNKENSIKSNTKETKNITKTTISDEAYIGNDNQNTNADSNTNASPISVESWAKDKINEVINSDETIKKSYEFLNSLNEEI